MKPVTYKRPFLGIFPSANIKKHLELREKLGLRTSLIVKKERINAIGRF